MKITFTATNPCHMWPTARAVAGLGALGAYHSGYPVWKLHGAEGLPVKAHSLRTNIVYGLLKYAPAKWRPGTRTLFRWQDTGFDRAAGHALERSDFVHAMPGQALHTFRAARKLGVRTVLNHATGPVREWVRIMRPEYERIGLKLEEICPYDAEYFAREDEEYALTDFHCAASTVVRDQLLGMGIPAGRVWVVPYGADTGVPVFHRGQENAAQERGPFRIVFAGQLGVRKGLQTLFDALAQVGRPEWEVHFVGARLPEAETDIAAYRGPATLHFHGAVSQSSLADHLRRASVLVLPSIEEGFGLVVPQALNCGAPCIVSDAVGGKDLVRHRDNGSIFPTRDGAALAGELLWWSENPRKTADTLTWEPGARTLLAESERALGG